MVLVSGRESVVQGEGDEMSDKVIHLNMMTKAPLPVATVLNNLVAAALSEVVVLGWQEDGSFYFAGSEADMRKAMMLVVLAQRWITDQYDLT